MLQMVVAGALVRPLNTNTTKLPGKETHNQVMIHQLINWIHMENPMKANKLETQPQKVKSYNYLSEYLKSHNQSTYTQFECGWAEAEIK